MLFKLCAATAALSIFACGMANADTPETYELTGVTDGALDGVVFTAEPFKIVATGLASGVQTVVGARFLPGTLANGDVPFPGYVPTGSIAIAITLGGVGILNVPDPGYVFNIQPVDYGGFGTSTHGDFLDFINPQGSTYDLVSSIGPISVSQIFLGEIITSDGPLFFSNSNGLMFTAIGAAVPEPQTWALTLIGFAGLGVSLRSRRRVSPTA